jgi:acyl dehydratase
VKDDRPGTVPKLVRGPNAFRQLVGSDLGYSEWLTVTQERVNLFADATGDHQWIDVEPERSVESPFGGTVAHGYLTLSLVPVLMEEVLQVEDVRLAVNYGTNKVRFPAPVLVGSEVRIGGVISAVDDVDGGVQVAYDVVIEVRDGSKPACVAQAVCRYYT